MVHGLFQIYLTKKSFFFKKNNVNFLNSVFRRLEICKNGLGSAHLNYICSLFQALTFCNSKNTVDWLNLATVSDFS